MPPRKTTKNAESVATSNTKTEVKETYEATLAEVELLQNTELNPEKAKEVKLKAAAVATAEAMLAESVERKISDLRMALGSAVDEIGVKLKDEIIRYRQTQEAVRLREEELRDIYGIEVKAASLAALVEAQKRRAADFDADMESRKAELEEEIATSRTAWDKE